MAGLPPTYLKVGKIVLYEEDELDRFLVTCKRQSTSEPDRVEQKRAASPPAPRSNEVGHDYARPGAGSNRTGSSAVSVQHFENRRGEIADADPAARREPRGGGT